MKLVKEVLERSGIKNKLAPLYDKLVLINSKNWEEYLRKTAKIKAGKNLKQLSGEEGK